MKPQERVALPGGAPEPAATPADSPGSVPSRRARLVRVALAAAGLLLFAAVLRSVGWSSIAANLARVGPWFAGLVALYALAQIAFALGWWTVFVPRIPLSRFGSLFLVYLAGDAANALAPGNVAGEPLKVHLWRTETGGSAALASITVHKHSDMLAQWIFMATGVGVALAVFPMPLAARILAVAATAGFGAVLAFLTFALPRRAYSPIVTRLARVRWKPLAGPLARLSRAASKVDARISSFYAEHPARFLESAAWCLAGWCGGLVETRILLHFLAPEAGWLHALAIEGLAMTLNNLFLFIPGRIGSAEGVRVAVFLLVGLPAAAGAAYGILRRGREIAWMIPGLATLMFRRGTPAPVAPVTASAGAAERGSVS